MVTSAPSVEVENIFKELKCITTAVGRTNWDNEYMK
jgi:hypothetical protein